VATGLELLKQYSKGRLLSVALSGGEPTTHPMFSKIIDEINSVGGFTEVITNGSRPIEWWNKLSSLPSLVVISLHPEFTDLVKVNILGLYLKSQNVRLRYNLMADPDNWEWVTAVNKKIHVTLHQNIDIKILTNHGASRDETNFRGEQYEYDSAQIEFIEEFTPAPRLYNEPRGNLIGHFEDGTTSKIRPFAIVVSNQHTFKGWQCTAGTNGLHINAKGDVAAGTCHVAQLGRINNFKLLPGPATCIFENCYRTGDITLDKFKPLDL
jgi:hypothetical protein